MASKYEAENAYAYGDAEESRYEEDPRAIPSAVGKLDNAVDEMRELVSVMEKRLSSVLAPEQTTPGNAEGLKSVRTRSDHAERLASIADRVHESRARLGNLLNRLDV